MVDVKNLEVVLWRGRRKERTKGNHHQKEGSFAVVKRS